MQFKRSKSINSKKVVSAVLAGMMAVSSGTAVLAAEDTASQAVVSSIGASLFNDVKNGYWAEKHIYKLASLGILLGNNGQFRPNDYVSQEEAITMAIRFMGLEGNLSSEVATIPGNLEVNNYFKPYVDLAFKQNLLNATEEASAGAEGWGKKKASREWITSILVRAIGKQADATAAAGQQTTFADNGSITPSKLGYVNVAIDLGLTTGLDGNRFDPTGSVTRAQLATFFSRADVYSSTSFDNRTDGIVVSLNESSIGLYADGKVTSFPLDQATAYFSSASEQRQSYSSLQLFTKVRVIASGGKTVYVEVLDPAVQLQSTEGTFSRISPGNILWIEANNTFKEFTYDAVTSFLDQNGNKIDPTTITAGSQLIIHSENTAAQKPVIVQVKSSVVNKTGAGILESINLTEKMIAFKDASGNLESYKWSDGLQITYQKQLINPSELSAGAEVKYTIQNNLIESIEVTKSVERKITGTLFEIGSSMKNITYTRDGSYEFKLLADKPEIVIQGVDKATLSDLIADAKYGDKVELTVNEEDKVTKITVLNRQIESKLGSTVISYDAKGKWLTFQDADKQAHVVKLDENTKISYNTYNEPTLAGMETLLKNTNLRINVNHIGDRALSVEAVYKYTGKVSDINTTSKKISITTAGGQVVTLPYSSALVQAQGKTGLTINDVKIGNQVTAYLYDDQQTIRSLMIQSVLQYQVTAINTTSGQVSVKTEGSSSTTFFTIASSAVKGTDGAVIGLAGLKAGDIINVTFDGNSAVAAQVVAVSMGEVTAVDTAAQTITIKTAAGNTQAIKVSGTVKINRAGIVSNSLSALNTGDRVDIRTDVDGSTVARVLAAVTTTYWKYDASTKEIYVKRQYISEKMKYSLAANAYIHQGDNTLTVQSLKENDTIVMYLNNDVVVEVLKQ